MPSTVLYCVMLHHAVAGVVMLLTYVVIPETWKQIQTEQGYLINFPVSKCPSEQILKHMLVVLFMTRGCYYVHVLKKMIKNW